MESCELFSTLPNDKCDLIEIKNDFLCLQSSVKHSSILAGVCCSSSYIDTFVQSVQNCEDNGKLMESPNAKSIALFLYQMLFYEKKKRKDFCLIRSFLLPKKKNIVVMKLRLFDS